MNPILGSRRNPGCFGLYGTQTVETGKRRRQVVGSRRTTETSFGVPDVTGEGDGRCGKGCERRTTEVE